VKRPHIHGIDGCDAAVEFVRQTNWLGRDCGNFYRPRGKRPLVRCRLTSRKSEEADNSALAVSQTFIDHLFEVLRARNPKLEKQEALWSAEIVLTAFGRFPARLGSSQEICPVANNRQLESKLVHCAQAA
jgi:hypothetical protein